jgi:opacity protein-like surface antigen
MKKLIMLIAIVMAFAISSLAQERSSYPRTELFIGYSYLGIDLTEHDSTENLNGWAMSFSTNLNRRFGVISEFSGNYRNNQQEHTFLFGPRFSSRGEHATVFTHILAGGATTKFTHSKTHTNPALAAGGGVEVKAGRNLALRFQADYLPIFSTGYTTQNLRLTTGVVFRFGGN